MKISQRNGRSALSKVRLNERAVAVGGTRKAISSSDRKDPLADRRRKTRGRVARDASSFSDAKALSCRGGAGVHPAPSGCSRPDELPLARARQTPAATLTSQSDGLSIHHAQPA